MKKQRYIGILSALASGLLLGISPMFVSIVNRQGVSSFTVCFMRFLISALLFFCYLTIRRIDIRLPATCLKKLFRAALCSSATTITLYSCYRYIGISAGTTIHFSYPILVILFSAVLFREKPDRKTLLCAVICSLGIWLFFDRQSDSGNAAGILLALLSAFLYSFYLITIERSGIAEQDPVVMSFYISFFNALLIGISDLLLFHQISLRMSVSSWGLCLLISLMTSVFATLFLQIAIRYTNSVLFSLLSLSEPLSSVLCGFLILQEPFSMRKAIGCLIILLSLLFLIRSEKQEESQ